MTLEPKAFARVDEAPDDRFYREPRFVEHIDAAAIAAVEALHRSRLPAGGTILDLMSSWVSHLPAEVAYAHVTGLGMNAAELDANPRLDARIVHDLNANPALPFAAASFDAATICVSIQYLTDPIAVLRDVRRTLRPGGTIVITFSNRCFPTKAVAVWRGLDDYGHLRLVARLLESAGWHDIEEIVAVPGEHSDPLFAVVATVPAVSSE